MAKKKGRRSLNVARKREKRNRDRKFRQKQLAIEKQRRLPYEKSEEAYLHACISQSRQLLDEPEFEGILFDFELMYTQVTEVLDNHQADETHALIDAPEDDLTHLIINVGEDTTSEEEFISEAERACEHFRLEVLPPLVTPDFMQRLVQALTACEKRFKLTGNREFAEVAYVTRSLFEVAPPEILTFHPMIQAIGIETLRILVEEPDMVIERREEVKEIFSNVLEYEDSEMYESQPISVFSDTGQNSERYEEKDPESASTAPVSLDVNTVNTEEAAIEGVLPVPTKNFAPPPGAGEFSDSPPSEIEIPPVSPDELPARALYKNFEGLALKKRFENRTDEMSLQAGLTPYVLVNENEGQVEFVDAENERYIIVTEERLQLHARSAAELTLAMAEVEAACTSAVMYLAKTIEERGDGYATQQKRTGPT